MNYRVYISFGTLTFFLFSFGYAITNLINTNEITDEVTDEVTDEPYRKKLDKESEYIFVDYFKK